MNKSISSQLLMLFLFIQILSALPAGWSFISDPSGGIIGISTDLLDDSPFADYLIPGLLLFIVLGLFPIIILYGLIKKRPFKLAEKINLYPNQHWSWTLAFYFGIVLVVWINVQLFFLKEFFIFQFIYSMLGVMLIILAHVPSTMKDYASVD
ncbi:MAG: hypothetical protein AAFZ15_19330 [Bacteroidota bacterium]